MQWTGEPGHYEVWYVTFTDPGTGVGFWIRYTMVAPLPETGEEATCSLWLMTMDPADPSRNVGQKVSFPVSAMSATSAPFELSIGGATLTDRGMAGTIEQDGTTSEWALTWDSRLPAYGHVHPLLRRAKIAKTILFLPHPELLVRGFVRIGERRIDVSGSVGGQAHLWGSKHAARWAWVHCNDFVGPDDAPRSDTFVDGVSVYVPRFGREIGPNTPVVARVDGNDVTSIGPLAVTRNPSEFGLDHWTFEARGGRRKLTGNVSARREDLVGVTYHDPDGELAYCYNTEVADMRLDLWERDGRRATWRKVDALRSDRHAHFEYAQRTPIDGVPLLVR
jgi:hypothetical protein